MTAARQLAVRADGEESSERLTVALAGEIDLATVGAVRSALAAALAEADGRTLVVDLRELTFMDSSGLNALCALRDRALRQRVPLVLVRGPRHVQRIFELTATDGLFEFVDEPARQRSVTA